MDFGVQLSFSFFFFIKSGTLAWGMVPASHIKSKYLHLSSTSPEMPLKIHRVVYCLENPNAHQGDIDSDHCTQQAGHH